LKFDIKIEKAFNPLKGKKVIVAFSGGVDSTLVAKLASEITEVMLITIVSDWISNEEIESAKSIALSLNLLHRFLEIEITSEHFWSNPPDRCYICKKSIFSVLLNFAESNGYDMVIDGTNASDTSGHRPGLDALNELNIYSPLLIGGITKAEVREIAKAKSLRVAYKPAMACLASRIPYGQHITIEKLKRIERGEKIIRELNIFSNFRLRDHEELARIEIDMTDLNQIMKNEILKDLNRKLKNIGYKYITLDLEGYRPSIP